MVFRTWGACIEKKLFIRWDAHRAYFVHVLADQYGHHYVRPNSRF